MSWPIASQIRALLGITTLSGSNTGDETTATVKSKLGVYTGQTEVDFGSTPVSESVFTIAYTGATSASKIIATLAYDAPTSKDLDELEMDNLIIKAGNAGTDTFQLYITTSDGSLLADKFKINYSITL